MSIPEERMVVPAPPRIGEALRAAGVDMVTNLWPLLPANVLWGLACLALALLMAFVTPLAITLAPLLGIPLGGVFRAAARVERAHGATLPDSVAAWRFSAVPSTGLALVVSVAAFAFAANLTVATTAGDPAAAVFATAGFWALLVANTYALVAWPLVVDPIRSEAPLGERLRLATLVLLGRPVRLILLAFILIAVLALSAALVLVLLSLGAAYVALVACRYVLPLADRLEERRTRRIEV